MILKREMKRNLKGLIIWSIVICGIVLLMLSIYPQMAAQQKGLDAMLEAYPDGLKKAFGMDKLDFGTLIGFYAVEVYMMTTLLGGIYASMLASNILVKEQSEKTIEFLLSKPVARTRVVMEKWLAVMVNLIIFNAVVVAASLTGFQFAKDSGADTVTFALLTAGGFLLHLTFAGVSFLLSAIVRRSRTVVSASLGIVFVTYFFSIMAGVSEKLDFLKFVSPFKYVDAAGIIKNNEIDPVYLCIMLGVIVLSVLSAHWYFNRKDISV